jgi:hypothetical protein
MDTDSVFDVFLHKAKRQGGHTYMAKQKRSEFFGIPTVSSGDVLHFSVRFPIISKKNKRATRTAEEFQKIYRNACEVFPRLEEFEKIIQNKLGKDTSTPPGTDWYRRGDKEKVALATLLVCDYMLRDSNIHVHTLTFQQFVDLEEHGSFTIFPARKIPFLIIVQLAQLQHVFVPGRYEGFRAVLESYGGKSRSNVKIDDPDLKDLKDSKWKRVKAAEIAKKMVEQYKSSSTAAIWRFSDFLGKNTFVSNQRNRKNNRLIVGIGFSFDAGAGNYPVIPPAPRNNPEQLVHECDDNDSELEDDDDDDEEDDLDELDNCELGVATHSDENKKSKSSVQEEATPESNTSGKPHDNTNSAPDNRECYVDDTCEQSGYGPDLGMEDDESEAHHEIDWATGSTLFHVGGRTFPKLMLPSTHFEKNVRLQQYSVRLRFAEGMKDPYSSVVGTPYINVNEKKHSFNFGNHLKQHKRFNQYLHNNMKDLRTVGNIARLERTEDNSTEENLEMESLLTNGIIHSMDRIEKHVQCFKAGPATIVAEFFANALLARVRILQEFMNSHFAEETDGDYFPLVHLINEVASHCRNFYSGRASASDKYVVGKSISIMYQRPVLSLLPGYLTDFIKTKSAKRFDQCWQFFLDAVKFENPMVFDRTGTIDLKYPSRVMACSRCFRLFTSLYLKDKYRMLSDEFDQHPCYKCNCKCDPTKRTDLCLSDELSGRKISCNNENCKPCLITVTTDTFKNHVTSEMKSLDKDQRAFVTKMVSEKHTTSPHHFLTGIAGSGKTRTMTVLIKMWAYIGKGIDTTAVTSLTKSASGLLYGSTLHRLFDIGTEEINDASLISDVFLPNLQKKPEVYFRLKNLSRLIIDECSMLMPQGLANINTMLQHITGKFVLTTGDVSENSFGGVEIHLVGDPMQLPGFLSEKKMSRKRKRSNNSKNLKGQFFFQYKPFRELFQIHILTTCHRQKGDQEFLEILNDIRVGKFSQKLLDTINNTWGKEVPLSCIEQTLVALKKLRGQEILFKDEWKPSLQRGSRFHNRSGLSFEECRQGCPKRFKDNMIWGDKRDLFKTTVICAQNKECRAISEHFDSLLYDKTRKDHGEFLAKFPDLEDYEIEEFDHETRFKMKFFQKNVNQKLVYYPGKLCKFTHNQAAGPSSFIANNQLGVVVRAVKDSQDNPKSLVIRPIYPDSRIESKEVVVTQMEHIFYWEKHGDKTCHQLGITDGYAGTDYLAQGLTLENDRFLIVNNERQINPGAFYAAISRSRNAKKMFILHRVTDTDIQNVNPVAKTFWTACMNEWNKIVKKSGTFTSFLATELTSTAMGQDSTNDSVENSTHIPEDSANVLNQPTKRAKK